MVEAPRRGSGESDLDEQISDTAAIDALLAEAAGRLAPCSVHSINPPDHYLSRLIRSGAERFPPGMATPSDPPAGRGTIVLEPPRARHVGRALATSKSARVELRDADRRLWFDSRVLGLATAAGESALVLAPPDVLFRRTRREAFRIRVPPSVPIRLTVDIAEPAWQDRSVVNLSTEGAMVTVTGSPDRFEPACVFDRGLLTLPDGRRFPVGLRVTHASVIRRSPTGAEMRIGLRFVQPPPGLELALTQLIESIARNSRTRPAAG